jgi:hypothetical protein
MQQRQRRADKPFALSVLRLIGTIRKRPVYVQLAARNISVEPEPGCNPAGSRRPSIPVKPVLPVGSFGPSVMEACVVPRGESRR